MTTGMNDFDLPPPKDWQKFERICRDLWAALWADPDTQANGRSGQAQAGVDVFGRRAGLSAYSGVQCKKRGNAPHDGEISEKELRAEVESAKSFVPRLEGEFVLAFTGKRDAKIQEVARQLCQEHARDGSFAVHVFSWDDIQGELSKYPSIIATHYASLVATFREVSRLLPDPAVESESPAASELIRTRSVIIEPSQTPADAEFSADIDLVRTALKEGHPRVALAQGMELKARIWRLANANTRARLLVLLAHANLDLDEPKPASDLLLEAAGQAPNDAYVQAQVAFGHSLAGNVPAAQTWATKALAQNPTDIIAVQVAALHDPRSDEEILSTHEPVIGKRAELYAILGHRASQRQERAAARGWFDRALELAPNDAIIKATAAQAAIDSVTSDSTSRFDGTMAARPDLLRAVSLLDDAIGTLGDENVRRARRAWFVSRVMAKRLLLAEDTVDAAEAALLACGRPSELIRLRAAIASDADDHKRVVELIEQLSTPREFDDVGLLAAAYGNLGQLERSVMLWREMLARADLPEHVRHIGERNLVLSLVGAGQGSEAREFVAKRVSEDSASASPLLLAALLAERLGEHSESNRLLEGAVAKAGGSSEYLRLQLGDALMRAERWADAAEVYALVVSPGADTYYGRRRLQALYKAGHYESLLAACDEVERVHGPIRYVAEMRSSVYELLGDLPRAEQACRAYLAVEPAHAVLGLRLALVLQRGGDFASSEAALTAVDPKAVRDVQSAGMLAQMLIRVGRPRDGLDAAYWMRKQHIRDVDAHMRYVSIYMRARDAVTENKAEPIALDSAVKLEGTGAPDWILLSSEPDADINQKEYPPDHDLSRALLGKRAGDTVQVRSSDRPWTVAAVGTRYGFAFGRTLEQFPSRFPNEGGLEQFEVASDDPELFAQQLKERLKRGEPQREAVLNGYSEGRIGVGGVARLLGLSIWETFGRLLGTPSGLICSTNRMDERSTGLDLLRDARRELVLDPTAVISLDEFGLLRTHVVPARRLVIAQRTLDAIAVEQNRWDETPDEGAFSVGLDENALVKREVGPEEVARRRAYFRDLLAWLRANAVIAAVSPQVAQRHALPKDVGDFIGDAFWDSVRIAAEPDRILISDDLWLRRLAANELSVAGACTAILLMAELDAGRLERRAFSSAVARMTVAGYRALSTDALVLEAAAQADGWRPGPWLEKVFGTLRGPETDERSAAHVAGDFIRSIWLNVLLSGQRTTLLLALLDSLAIGRPRAKVAADLTARLRVVLRFHPVAEEEARRVIVAWNEMRGIELVGRN